MRSIPSMKLVLIAPLAIVISDILVVNYLAEGKNEPRFYLVFTGLTVAFGYLIVRAFHRP